MKYQKSKRAKALISRRKAIKNGFRSKLEEDLSKDLNKKVSDYGYETDVIEWRYTNTRKYTPDFVLTKKDGSKMYIEAKGKFYSKDRTKMKYVKEQHPDLDIRFIFQRGTNKISKVSTTTYMAWAKRHGFPAHDCKGGSPVLPDEWLEELL